LYLLDRLSELPAEVTDAIEASKMNPAHDHLNSRSSTPLTNRAYDLRQ
jgi:hypothetical protein